MKKKLLLYLILLGLTTGFATLGGWSRAEKPAALPEAKPVSVLPEQEVRGMWISYLDLQPILTGKSREAFQNSAAEMMDNISKMGLNRVFVQVRPFGDALYPSRLFPWSACCTGTQGQSPGYDPLAILLEEAHRRSLHLEAWVNPFRVKAPGQTAPLSEDNPAQKWLSDKDDAAIVYQDGVYLNPGREKVLDLIVAGIEEILDSYPVDGIHFDDYFYPSPDESFDRGAYTDYCRTGGTLSLGDWRRQNVGRLLHRVHTVTQKAGVPFGISPQGNMKNNLSGQYVDIEAAIRAEELEYLCPQIYFGFDNQAAPYGETVDRFDRLVQGTHTALYVGLAPYKLGREDPWAGQQGKTEWQTGEHILARQIETARSHPGYGGFALFRYRSVFAPESTVSAQVQAEAKDVEKLLK